MSNAERWAKLPGNLLLFLLLVYPLIPQLVYTKAALLGGVLIIVFLVVLKTGRWGLHPIIALWTLALSIAGIFFIMEGFVSGGPGASRSIGVYVVWPILYMVMLSVIRSESILCGLVQTMMLATICICLFSVIYMLIQIRALPESELYNLVSFNWDKQEFALHEGYINMQYPGINSLPFLVPFSIGAVVAFQRWPKHQIPLSRGWLRVAAFSGLLAAVVSGRRALILGTVLAPLFVLALLRFQPVAMRQVCQTNLKRVCIIGFVAFGVLLGALNIAAGISISGLYERVSIAFDFSPSTQDNGANERRDQFEALLAGWMENPLLGVGHGVPAFGSIRSETQPWSYELKYMALLYQTGILGFGAYAAGVLWIFWMGIRVLRDGGFLSLLMLASLTGMTSMLIAGSTNPYLDNFDGMWAIFFPLSVINLSMVTKRYMNRLPVYGSALFESGNITS